MGNVDDLVTIVVRGERYQVSLDPETWPALDTMIIEQNIGRSLDELSEARSSLLIALGYIGVRQLEPRKAWKDYVTGLTLGDLDIEAVPDSGEDDADPPAEGGDPAHEGPESPNSGGYTYVASPITSDSSPGTSIA